MTEPPILLMGSHGFVEQLQIVRNLPHADSARSPGHHQPSMVEERPAVRPVGSDEIDQRA